MNREQAIVIAIEIIIKGLSSQYWEDIDGEMDMSDLLAYLQSLFAGLYDLSV